MDNNHPQSPNQIADAAELHRLLTSAKAILTIVAAAGVDLSEPTEMLAFQLLGPALSKAMGADHRAAQENLCEIVDKLDVSGLRKLLRGGR